MTVEKLVDNKEQNELKDLKTHIESLAMIMKSATMGKCKTRSGRGSVLHKEERSAK